MIRVVLDTNVVWASFLAKSKYRKIIQSLIDGRYELLISPEIGFEYEEKLMEFFDNEVANSFLDALYKYSNVIHVTPFFDFRLIRHDSDDDKFVNCAIAGSAHYIVTNDKHFNILKSISFPKLNVINIDEFIEILNQIKK